MNIFKKLINWVKDKFEDLSGLIRNNSGIAVKVTDRLKNIVLDSKPIVDILTDLIPGDVDDKIHKKLVVLIPKIADKLAITHGILQANNKNSDALTSIIEYLKDNHPGLQVSFWVLFSGELNKALSDDKISLSEAIALSQLMYEQIKKNK